MGLLKLYPARADFGPKLSNSGATLGTMGLGPPELGEGCDSDVALPLHEASLSIPSTSFRGPARDWASGGPIRPIGCDCNVIG